MKPFQTGQQNQRLFQAVRLEDLVPDNHILRRINAAVDFDFIRDLVADTYDQKAVRGRPPWDPVVLFKMMLLGFLFDLSDHRLEQEVGMHAGYRWFLDLDFEDPVPDRTTLIRNRQRWGLARFQPFLNRCWNSVRRPVWSGARFWSPMGPRFEPVQLLRVWNNRFGSSMKQEQSPTQRKAVSMMMTTTHHPARGAQGQDTDRPATRTSVENSLATRRIVHTSTPRRGFTRSDPTRRPSCATWVTT